MLTIDYNVFENRLGEKMNFNHKKKIKNLYKEIIMNSTKEEILQMKSNKKQIKRIIEHNLILLVTEIKNTKKEILDNIACEKYFVNINQLGKIITIIKKYNRNIKIDYIAEDRDPVIYFYKENNLYLINCDSIENKWYLSLIEKETLELIKEIYSSSYNDFINYLENKSH